MACMCEMVGEPEGLWIEIASAAGGDCVARTFSDAYGWQGLLVEGTPEWDMGFDREPGSMVRRLAHDHVGFWLIQVGLDGSGTLWSRDMPAAIWVRQGTALPMAFRSQDGAVQAAALDLQHGDYLVLLSRGYAQRIAEIGQNPAIWIRRWASTGLDATQLRDAVSKSVARLAGTGPLDPATTGMMAMHARPIVSATVWSGPPSDPALDRQALEALMAETGYRVICGDTTAQIAARLLGQPLRVEQLAPQYRTDVPPVAYVEGIDLVTEGLITMRAALSWLQSAESRRDLAQRVDAATRLACVLMGADRIHFIIGKGINPVQVTDSDQAVPLRLALVERLMEQLVAKGKRISARYL